MVSAGRDPILRYLQTRRLALILSRQRRAELLLEDAEHPLIDKIMDQPGLVKTHFMLRRMDVDIHLVRVNLKVQDKSRLLIGPELIFTGLANSVVDQPIAHHTAVDVAVLDLRQRRIGMQRIGHPAAEGQIAVLPLNRQRLLKERRTADSPQPPLALSARGYGAILAHRLAVMAEINRDVETRQRDAADDFIDVVEFRLFGTHKLTACRGVIEQIQHFQRGADRVRRWLDGHVLIAPFGVGLPGLLLLRRAGGQGQPRHRADTGQRFPAKAKADNGFQIVKRGNFTGGVASQRQRQLVLFDAAAVVPNADKLRAAAFDININSGRAGIKAVFDQLLNHRRRTFHHLPCGNLVGELRRQNLNRHD